MNRGSIQRWVRATLSLLSLFALFATDARAQSAAPRDASQTAAQHAVAAVIANLTLPDVPANVALEPIPPCPVVVVHARGIALDESPALSSWTPSDRARVTASLPADLASALPLVFDSVPSFRDFALPPAELHGGARGIFIDALGARADSLQHVEGAIAAALGRARSPSLTLMVDPRAPIGLVDEVLATMQPYGFTDYALAVGRGAAPSGALLIHTPQTLPHTAWTLIVNQDAIRIRVVRAQVTYVQPDCHTFGASAVVLPRAAGHFDTSTLVRCFQSARRAATGVTGDRTTLSLVADAAIPYGDVVALIAAMRETRPRAHDLFANALLGVGR